MDSSVSFAVLPRKWRQPLSVDLRRQLRLWMSCVDRVNSGARSAVPTYLTPSQNLSQRNRSSGFHASLVPVMCYLSFKHITDACHSDTGKSSEDESLSLTYNGGGVIPILTRMARDSLRTRRSRQEMRQVNIIHPNGLC